MRKGRDGGKKRGKKNGEKKKREKTDENSGHYAIASSRPPERRPLERRTLAPIWAKKIFLFCKYENELSINFCCPLNEMLTHNNNTIGYKLFHWPPVCEDRCPENWCDNLLLVRVVNKSMILSSSSLKSSLEKGPPIHNPWETLFLKFSKSKIPIFFQFWFNIHPITRSTYLLL